MAIGHGHVCLLLAVLFSFIARMLQVLLKSQMDRACLGSDGSIEETINSTAIGSSQIGHAGHISAYSTQGPTERLCEAQAHMARRVWFLFVASVPTSMWLKEGSEP